MAAPSDISDADLRSWARDNGVEGVPGSGKLSAAWREKITIAMAMTWPSGVEERALPLSQVFDGTEAVHIELESDLRTDLEIKKELGLGVDPVVGYRSVFVAPNTFVTSQHFTS